MSEAFLPQYSQEGAFFLMQANVRVAVLFAYNMTSSGGTEANRSLTSELFAASAAETTFNYQSHHEH